jgi:uncharacterized protein YdaU (DUF1376 family)
MSNAPFMQLYVGDYLTDTRHLTTEQHGAYLLILMTMWSKGGSLPNDPKKLARIAGLTGRKWASVWEEISEFFTEDGEQIVNQRLQKEYKKARDKSELRSQAGSKGGRAKALKNNNQGVANARALPKHGQKSEPDIDNKEDKSSSLSCDDGYQKFLAIHPRPRETPEGAQSWSQAVAAGQDPESLIAAARRYAEAASAFDADKVKFSDNWLRDRSWEKYPEAAAKRPVGRREVLQFNADWVNGDKFISPNVISRSMVEELVGAGFVTEARAKERGLL